MSFVDVLRTARSSRVAVLHEFWTQYDPGKRRLHAFFEGHEDCVFFRFFLREIEERGWRLYAYRCDGKSKVYEAFDDITRRMPNVRRVLFFVDKDLDDILGTPWVTDPRIYVTDVYSIENYLATASVLQSFLRDCVRSNSVRFDIDVIGKQFEAQLGRFHRRMLPIMAWILTVRRSGQRPNLSNVNMKDLLRVSEDCALTCANGRVAALERATGVKLNSPSVSRVLGAAKELARLQPKRVMRGKFEIWFFLEFWKKVRAQLERLAKEMGGTIQFMVPLERGTLVATLCAHATVPRGLDLFLRSNLSDILNPAEPQVRSPERPLWRRVLGALFDR